MLNYFSDIFTSATMDLYPILNCIRPKIPSSHNQLLLRPTNGEEVKRAVFSMHPDKSHSQSFSMQSSLCTPRPQQYPHCSHTQKKNPENMDDLCPIALCNVAYKIVAKVMVNRLKGLLDKVIAENQNAFVPSRMITDNIMVAFKAHQYLMCKKQGKDGFTALKLSLSKAFDCVQWFFLRAMLHRLRLCDNWISLIMECVSIVDYHILHDGNQIGPIILSRGLRQRDPISPYLFIIVAEGLSTMMKDAKPKGLLHGIQVAQGAPKIYPGLFCILSKKPKHLQSVKLLVD
nr:ribonuclease H [Ipomoea batatas]